MSLALVDSTGRHRFYGEIDPLPIGPTTFVRETVYPLLERGTAAMAELVFAASLRRFLSGLPEPRLVMADHPTDFSLFSHALEGFGTRIDDNMPAWKSIEATMGDVLIHIENYFEARPEARARRHHAGVDAEALRWVFERVIEGAMR